MFNFIYRFIIGFSTVAVVYYAYALVIVPLIDHRVTQKKIETQHPSQTSSQRYDQLITEIFPEDDWIRERCKILDAKQSILFFKEARQLEDGNWEVKPFTMFLNPDQALVDSKSGDPADRPEQPIILRTDEGAYIQFEDGVSPNSPSGKFSGARMPGKVVVIREPSAPGAGDNFRFETRNIQVNTKQILAVNPVSFEYGRHHGSGHNLTINLAVDGKPDQRNRRMPLVKNLKTVELAHLDEIMLMPDAPDEAFVAKASSNDPSADPEGIEKQLGQAPIRVTCAGPFRLDFGKSRMVLFDQVHVEQLHPSQPHDHLHCDRLEVLFKLGGTPSSKSKSDDEAGDPDRLRLRTITAHGEPAKLMIDSKNAYAQAHQLDYHIGRRIIHCRREVVLRDGDHQFRAPEMEYQLTTNNQLGTGWATGPGEIVGYPDDPTKVFKATWQSEFNIQPHEGKKAVSMHGNAQIVFQGEKHFHCEELHFWIWEKRKRGERSQWEFFPAQLLGLRQVTLHAPEFGGRVEELRLFWPRPIGVLPLDSRDQFTENKKAPGPGKLASHPRKPSASADRSPTASARRTEPVTNRIVGEGKIATAFLTRQNELRSFRLEGDRDSEGQPLKDGRTVHVQSLDLEPTFQQLPHRVLLDVVGDDIQVDALEKKDAFQVSVSGQPATIEADGVKFTAPLLVVDQAANRAWSQVPGQVEISPAIQAKTRPFGPEPKTTIYWNNRFEFDGSILRLTDDIRFEGLDYLDSGEQVTFEGRTKQLAARTNRHVDFSKSLPGGTSAHRSGGRQPVIKIEELALLESAFLKATTRQSIDEVQSVDEIQATEINLRTDTGAARAIGPGSIRSIRASGNPERPAGSNAVAGIQELGGPLNYLEVAFQGEIVGNVKERRGKILENIRAVYGPARDWNVRYDPDATSIFGEEIYLNCDEMNFSQWTPARSTRAVVEIAAVGNTELEGKKFRALASQLTYTAENEIVQLEGLDRTNARIWFRKNQNQPWQYGEAKKFRYQKSTSEIVGSEGVQEMRFLQFEAPQKRRQ